MLRSGKTLSRFHAGVLDEFQNPHHYDDMCNPKHANYRLRFKEEKKTVEQKLKEGGMPAKLWRDGKLVLEVGYDSGR